VLFNLLIGNADAHGKNFALLFDENGPSLAPAYDLLCTQAYPVLSQAFAMKVGPARRQEELTPAAWSELARDARADQAALKARGLVLASAVLASLRELPMQLMTENPSLKVDVYPARRRDDFLRMLADVIVGNCKRVSRSLLARG
jgi:serine/threonine-protein kinase HipA